jgi:hypothetical protein
MPELRTRSAGAKVTDKEYAEIEKLAQARGLNVGEWCREVILQAMAEAGTPSVETLLAEIVALRMIFLNVMAYAAQRPGELTTEKMQERSTGPTRRGSAGWPSGWKSKRPARNRRARREKNRAATAAGNPHFFRRECTERGGQVKGLRFASMNAAKSAAPLTRLPLRSVCFQPSKKCD